MHLFGAKKTCPLIFQKVFKNTSVILFFIFSVKARGFPHMIGSTDYIHENLDWYANVQIPISWHKKRVENNGSNPQFKIREPLVDVWKHNKKIDIWKNPLLRAHVIVFASASKKMKKRMDAIYLPASVETWDEI
ncbi:hypothetical protein ACJX0J_024410, partial [Zea mays]